jgi:hypothetical protein
VHPFYVELTQCFFDELYVRIGVSCASMQVWSGATSAASPMGMLSLHMLKLGCPYSIALLWREFLSTVAEQHCHKLCNFGGLYSGVCMYTVGRPVHTCEEAASHPDDAPPGMLSLIFACTIHNPQHLPCGILL